MEYVAHLATHKLKYIKQVPRETIREYDKRFKDILNQISYKINANLLVQWYVLGLLHHIKSPLRIHDSKHLKKHSERCSKWSRMSMYLSQWKKAD